mgnify:CR=1 FL=1
MHTSAFSTEEQNKARQIEALKKHGIGKWITEKISSKSMDRSQLQAMLDYVREGILSISMTLAVLPKDLLEIVERLQAKGASGQRQRKLGYRNS